MVKSADVLQFVSHLAACLAFFPLKCVFLSIHMPLTPMVVLIDLEQLPSNTRRNVHAAINCVSSIANEVEGEREIDGAVERLHAQVH